MTISIVTNDNHGRTTDKVSYDADVQLLKKLDINYSCLLKHVQRTEGSIKNYTECLLQQVII